MEVGGARPRGHLLFSCVDEFRVPIPGGRRRSHAQQSVLGVQHDLTVVRDELCDQHRHADPQVDVGTVGDVLRGAPGDLVLGESSDAAAHG